MDVERGKPAQRQANQLEGKRIESEAGSVETKDVGRIPLPEKARSPDKIFWIMPGLLPLSWFCFGMVYRQPVPSGPGFDLISSFFYEKSMRLRDDERNFWRYAQDFRGFKKLRKAAGFFESGRILTEKRHDSPDFGRGAET